MKIYVHANYQKRETQHSMQNLLRWAVKRDVRILMRGASRKRIAAEFWSQVFFTDHEEDAVPQDCRYIVTVGGDGTLIRSAALSARTGIPLVGVNTGTLGFLAGIEPEEVAERMDDLYWGRNFTIESRMGIQATLEDRAIPFAINDIVLQKSTHGGLAGIDIRYGKEMIGRYRSDGLILSTPTGSTAYAYAAGGPAIAPRTEVLSVLPICPQNRMNIPLIVGTEEVISLSVRQGTMRVLADGTDCGALHKGEKMQIRCAVPRMKLVRFSKDWGILDWQEKVSKL